MPRCVEVELTRDLVGSVIVGDVVTVCGFVKVLAAGEGLGEWRGQGARVCVRGGGTTGVVARREVGVDCKRGQ